VRGGERIRLSKRKLATVAATAVLLLSIVLLWSMIGGNDKPDITTDIPEQPDSNPDEGVDDGDTSDGTGDDDQSSDDGDQSDDTGDDDAGDDDQSDDDQSDDQGDDDTGDDDQGDDDQDDDDDEEESAPYRHRNRERNGERNGAPEVQNVNCMEDEEQKEAVRAMEPEANYEDADKGEKAGQQDMALEPEPVEEEPVTEADVGQEQNQEQKSDGQTNGNSQRNCP
jgi:hypothetical protein